jgi:D-arabinose 1-dehydrogenase-like Zn-dependent alcohol dehydrogenase
VFEILNHWFDSYKKRIGGRTNSTLFTTSPSRIEDTKAQGADAAVFSTAAAQMKGQSGFDMILDTVSARHNVNTYLKALKVDGSLVLVGLSNRFLSAYVKGIYTLKI